MKTLFLAWRDPESRHWYPVGRLQATPNGFVFVYLNGAQQASREAGFAPLAAFPNLQCSYTSDALFPLFANRLMNRSQPDYGQYLQWLSIAESEADPILVLARSGGQRVTDTLEVFPRPERSPDGTYELRFFVHGLSLMPEASVVRAGRLKPGERLLVMWDPQNAADGDALALRTAATSERDVHLLGYVPRYLCHDILHLIIKDGSVPDVTVERVNAAPAPLQFRILCKARMQWAEGEEPFEGFEYQPLSIARPEPKSRVA